MSLEGEAKRKTRKDVRPQTDRQRSVSPSEMASGGEECPKTPKASRTKRYRQRSASPSKSTSRGEENPKTPKASRTKHYRQRSASRSDTATEREKKPKTTKESELSKADDKHKAPNAILHVGPNKVKYLDFRAGNPAYMAATNLHGAFIVCLVSPRAGLMAHIAPTRESLQKPSDPGNPKDKEQSILHVKTVLNEMRNQWNDHYTDLTRTGRYMVVACAKFHETTAAGALPLEVELKTIMKHLPTVPVMLTSYLVRNEHGSDEAANSGDMINNTINPNHGIVWLDPRRQRVGEERHVTASPVLWVGDRMIHQDNANAEIQLQKSAGKGASE